MSSVGSDTRSKASRRTQTTKATASKASDQPCDQCFLRKVKCDGGSLCSQCSRVDLQCSWKIVRKRRGPKPGSGSTIRKLRSASNVLSSQCQQRSSSPETRQDSPQDKDAELQDRYSFTSGYDGAQSQSPASNELCQFFKVNEPQETIPNYPEFSEASHSWTSREDAMSLHTSYPALHTLPLDLDASVGINIGDGSVLTTYIDTYFAIRYPIWPILHEDSFRDLISRPDQLQPSEKCLILSLCSVVALYPLHPSEETVESRLLASRRLVERCLQARLTFDYIEATSISTMQTSFFLSTAYFELKKFRSSWMFLQEAIGFAQVLGCHKAEGLPLEFNHVENLCYQRTLFLLSLTSRATILRSNPATISKLQDLPEVRLENEDPLVLFGLQCLGQLYGLLDENFMDLWNKPMRGGYQAEAAATIVTAQHTLSSLIFEDQDLLSIQKADILVTQQWLRLIFWQAAVRQGLLSSSSKEPFLSYHFPLIIAESLCEVLACFASSTLLVHGLGIVSTPYVINFQIIRTINTNVFLICSVRRSSKLPIA
jgi:hypothetical protein